MLSIVFVVLIVVRCCNAFQEQLDFNLIDINVPQGLKNEFDLGLPARVWDEIKFCGSKTIYIWSDNENVVHKYTITGEKLQFDFGRQFQNVLKFIPTPQCDGYAISISDGSIKMFENGKPDVPTWVISNSEKCSSITVDTLLDVTCFDGENSNVRSFFNGIVDGTTETFGGKIAELPQIITHLVGHTDAIVKKKKNIFFLYNNLPIPSTPFYVNAEIEVKATEQVRFTWKADSEKGGEDEEYSHHLYKDLPDRNSINSAFRVYHSGVSKEHLKVFTTTIGPGAPGFYQMATQCENSVEDCDFDDNGIDWKIEYLIKDGDSFGCTGDAFQFIGGFKALACPLYDFNKGSKSRINTGNFVVFDSQNKYIDHEHPSFDEGTDIFDIPLMGEKFTISNGIKIYATQRETANGSIKLKRYALIGTDLQRTNGFVYDTNVMDMDDLTIVGDGDSNTDVVYVIERKSNGNSTIKTLQPASNTQTKLIQLLDTTNVVGKVTAFGGKLSQGNFIVAVDGQNITGFVSEGRGNIDPIPFTKSGKVFSLYPKNLAPKTFTDFILLPGIVQFSQTELDMSIFDLIKRRIQNTALKGYVAATTTVGGVKEERVVDYLQGRGLSPELFGPLQVRPNHNFYEVLPILTHFFDYEDDPRTCIPNIKYCLYTASNEEEARDVCFEISRCEGYVETCLIEARSYSTCSESTTKFYNKKKYRHRVFEYIGENTSPFIIVSSVVATLHFLYVFRFHKVL